MTLTEKEIQAVLDAPMVDKTMTVAEALTMAFNDDWNFRKTVANSKGEGDIANLSLTLRAPIPMAVAKLHLSILMGQERQGNKT